MALAGDRDGDEFCDDPFDDDEDDDDGEGEEFYDDDSDGEEFCGDPCDDDDSEAEVLCGDPCDDEDEDDGEGEESCDDPCEDDEDEEFCDDDDDDDDDFEGEELCDDEEAGEGEGEDLCDEPSGEEGEGEGEEFCSGPCDEGGSGGGGGEGVCVSGFSNPDGSDLSDSLEASGLNGGGEGLIPPPAVGAFRMLVSADDTDIDSDSYSDDDDDSTYSDVGDVEPGTLPASRAAVDGLPEASLSEEEALCGCAVCKDVFASGQRVVWLPCKHYFHGDCIRPWLAIRSTCPVCRYQLPTDDAESGQQQARQLMVLVPVAHQGAPPQSGGGGRGEGDGGGATIGAGDATECSAQNGLEQSAP